MYEFSVAKCKVFGTSVIFLWAVSVSQTVGDKWQCFRVNLVLILSCMVPPLVSMAHQLM